MDFSTEKEMPENEQENQDTPANAFEDSELYIDTKTDENKKLNEELSQSGLKIKYLEKMICATTTQINGLIIEFNKNKGELSAILQAEQLQNEYQSKEISSLKRELEDLSTILEGRNKRLRKICTKNEQLQGEITSNRYKIFCLHFNGLDEEQEIPTESSYSSDETFTEENNSSKEKISENESY